MTFVRIYNFVLILMIIIVPAVFSQNKTSVPAASLDDLRLLVRYMTGSFSSQAQSISDSNYYDIRLEMVPIWKELEDGYWLYVEQAAASSLNKPYRQRVYHLTVIDSGQFQSAVYVIKEPLRFAGEWQKENPLAALTPDSLGLREGCAIILSKDKSGCFIGEIHGKKCESALSGAKYTTSYVKIGPDEIISWDRGFDANDKQVWGAKVGGYIFKKVKL